METLSDLQVEQLKAPLPEDALSPHPAKTFLTVINPMAVIDRLNLVFGYGGWHWETQMLKISEVQQGKRQAYMSLVHGKLTIPRHNILVEQFGGSTNDDMGDASKGGSTDALTKCASYLGIGASIYKGQGNVVLQDEHIALFPAQLYTEFERLVDMGEDGGMAFLAFLQEHKQYRKAIRGAYLEKFRESREIGSQGEILNALETLGHTLAKNTADHMLTNIAEQTPEGAVEAWQELSDAEKRVVWGHLPGEVRDFLKQNS